jgi:chromosomal replication initiator protein
VPEALPEDLAAAWERAREELRESLPPSTFDLWLEPLRPVSARGATLYVSAPSSIHAWVERRYLGRLAEALRGHVPELCEVRLLAGGGTDPAAAASAPEPFPVPRGSTFDRFVIGAGNRIAHAAALAVAELPGEAYNPLFLHGAPGLGKTHLLGAIARYLEHHRPDLTIHYTTAERFTAEFVTALRHSGTERFKERYRGLSVLLIDDVQFLENKPQTEEEFFHTFNALYETGGQIVLSCDRPPEALSRLAERLRDRFEWGLRVELSPPDLRTRITLLEHLAAHQQSKAGPEHPPPADALREIAMQVPANFRRLEGALIRVVALSSISGEPPTAELVRRVFERESRPASLAAPLAEADRTAPTIHAVQDAVCAVLHLSRDDLLSPSRAPRITRGRHLAMYLARDITGLSLADIARAFKRDHSTVIHAIRRVEASLEPGTETHRDLEESRALLGIAATAPSAPSTGGAVSHTELSQPNAP